MTDITLGGVSLPADLHWIDEYGWTPVMQTTEYLSDGTLLVMSGARLAGRFITLQNPQAWVPRSTVEALYALLSTDDEMALVLADGRTFTVRWRHKDTPIDAAPLVRLAPQNDTDHYTVTLRLLETDPA